MSHAEEFEGKAEELAGKVQEGIGRLTGDTETEIHGKARQRYGEAQSALAETCDTVKSFTADYPLTALGIAAGIGFLVGVITGRR
ncbi:CsbD family protein [Granulibacter bethesdensis]|nr:CsbD family protein [Granulibacter bethesdensis]